MRFSTITQPTDLTFWIDPAEGQAESLETDSYVQLIACGLERHGLRRAESRQTAGLIVESGFLDDGGRKVTQTLPAPIVIAAPAGGSPGLATRVPQTTLGSRTTSYVMHTRTVWIKIRPPHADEMNRPLPVFEGRATCATVSTDAARLLPAMITALLKDVASQQGTVEDWNEEMVGIATALDRCRQAGAPHGTPAAR
ncbi:MAG: hypothetical protein LW806_10830 [Planctomycetaceae bacterium]|nr:hypothetical protein [Planctomycetaceae bacterium]